MLLRKQYVFCRLFRQSSVLVMEVDEVLYKTGKPVYMIGAKSSIKKTQLETLEAFNSTV